MPFYGKNSKISTDYVDIYNSWCHFSGDSYFTQNTYPKIVDNGSSLYGLANLSSSDTWRTMANFDFYAATSNSSTITQISCIAAGALPSFGNNFWKKTEPYYVEEVHEYSNPSLGTYTIEVPAEITCSRSDTALVIGDSTFKAANFRDNFIPRFVIAAVQGAGGGGGGTQLSDDGTGGGGGGFICGVVRLPSSFVIKVGEGGYGGGYIRTGQYGTTATGDDKGDDGEDSYISSGDTVILKACGGTGGPKSTKSESATPGQGGSYSYTSSSAYCISSRKGGNGGKVYSLQNATGCAALTAKATASSSYTSLGSGSGLLFYKTWSATSGGAQGHNNAPGGGGGSMLSSGPAGGGYTSDGNPGSLGAGGSGARYTFATYMQGGRGGDGAVYLWY